MTRKAKRGEDDRELDPILARALSRLRDEVAEKGLSQSDLATGSGLTQGHVSKILNGLNPEASFFVVAKLALAAGVSLDFLVAPAPAPGQFARKAAEPAELQATPSLAVGEK